MIKNKSNYVTCTEAADLLGFSADYVRKLLGEGKLQGEKFGHNWIIDKKELAKIKRQRFPRAKEKISNGSRK